MKHLSALGVVTGVFALGVLVGALGAHVAQRHWPGHARLHGHGAVSAEAALTQLKAELKLRPDQAAAFDRLVEQTHAEARDLHEELAPRVHELVARTHERVEALLTPEQREAFRSFVRGHEALGEQFFLGHLPPEEARH